MDKKRFVSRLGILLADVKRLEIYSLLYVADGGDEYVDIKYQNGAVKTVCITGDSELAIIKDVIKHLD